MFKRTSTVGRSHRLPHVDTTWYQLWYRLSLAGTIWEGPIAYLMAPGHLGSAPGHLGSPWPHGSHGSHGSQWFPWFPMVPSVPTCWAIMLCGTNIITGTTPWEASKTRLAKTWTQSPSGIEHFAIENAIENAQKWSMLNVGLPIQMMISR